MNNKLDSTQSYVAYYLEKLRSGDYEPAFHALGDVGPTVVPMLVDAFRVETKPDVRAELVDIICNYRLPETVFFLSEALSDSDPKVWKSALDGLVTLASPATLQILRTAICRESPDKKKRDEYHKWVNEAIAQVQEAIAPSSE